MRNVIAMFFQNCCLMVFAFKKVRTVNTAIMLVFGSIYLFEILEPKKYIYYILFLFFFQKKYQKSTK